MQPPGITDGITPEQISTISKVVIGSIGSQGTVGGLVVAGVVSIFARFLRTFDEFQNPYSYSKQLVGEFCLVLVLCMVACTFTKDYLGQMPLRNVHLNHNMSIMQLKS